jgi:hypothetical protein
MTSELCQWATGAAPGCGTPNHLDHLCFSRGAFNSRRAEAQTSRLMGHLGVHECLLAEITNS